MEAPDLETLAFEFFRQFARCEYCLKAVGLRENSRDAKADWRAFAAEICDLLNAPQSQLLKGAISYYLEHPPKKQVVINGILDWEAKLPDHKSQAELLLLLVCRVRNNLFHGGKFNGHYFEPQRSERLITHGLVILQECIEGHKKVFEAYSQRTD